MDKNYLGIHHCEILVTDIDAALKFYTEVVGLEELPNASVFSQNKWLKLGNQELHIVFHPVSDANEERHFAILVKDLERARTNLANRGAEIKSATPIPGVDRFFIFDPFGNRIEFVQMGAS